MDLIRCIIVDDDPVSREAIKSCVQKAMGLQLIGIYSNAFEAGMAIQKYDIDLVFLDVEMPEMSGLEFLEKFKEIPQVIMVTSEKKYAFDAFRFDVTDYISKPIDMERFTEAVDRARYYEQNLVKHKEDDYLFIKADGVMVKLLPSEIAFVEAMGDYVKVQTLEKRYIVHSTMKAFVAKLPLDFQRVHKSFIVNINHVERLEDNHVYGSKFEIPVSRTYKKELKDKMAH